jgi:hypothetical protein
MHKKFRLMTVFIGSIAILALMFAGTFWKITFISEGILGITAIIILWYTWETSQIRKADNGHLDFSISFTSPLRDGFVLQYFGSSEVRLNGVVESKHSVRVRFIEPCPDMVTFVFFNLEVTPNVQPHPADAG